MFGIEEFNYRYVVTSGWSDEINSIKRSNGYISLLKDDEWLYRAIFMNHYIDDVDIGEGSFRIVGGKVAGCKGVGIKAMVDGSLSAYDFISSTIRNEVTEKYVRGLHKILTEGVFPNSSGRYRTRKIEDETGVELLSPRSISDRMGDILSWYNSRRVKFFSMSNIEVLTVLAELFQSMHFVAPFSVRSNFLTRLLVQKELIYAGLPPILFDCCGKAKYGIVTGKGFNDYYGDVSPYILGYLANCLIRTEREII